MVWWKLCSASCTPCASLRAAMVLSKLRLSLAPAVGRNVAASCVRPNTFWPCAAKPAERASRRWFDIETGERRTRRVECGAGGPAVINQTADREREYECCGRACSAVCVCV